MFSGERKMKNRFAFLLIFFSIVCMADTPFNIEHDRMESIIRSALNGNAKSANDLALYYEFSQNISAVNRDSKTLYWLMIAAENDTKGFYMKELSSYLIATNPTSKDRGLYWLYLSSKRGNQEAREDIENIYYKYNFEFANDSDFTNSIINNKEDYIIGALHGSGEAALHLSHYYRDANDINQYEYWLRIGAQNGSKKCMKDYANLLRRSSDKYDNIRAEFWKKKAKL